MNPTERHSASGNGFERLEILSEQASLYLRTQLKTADPILREMEAEARERNFPIIGPESGRVLYLIAKMTAARRIFEMGSGFGYSTFWFASATAEDAEIHHTEGDAKNSESAKQYLSRGGLDHKVQFHVGTAQDALRETEGLFDIILIDVDKEAIPRVPPFGHRAPAARRRDDHRQRLVGRTGAKPSPPGKYHSRNSRIHPIAIRRESIIFHNIARARRPAD